MTTLSIDIETYSDVDISLGVYKYVESEAFRILLFAYQIDDSPVKVVDLTSTDLPGHLLNMLKDDTVVKTAFNAAFERTCLNAYYSIQSKNWECTMIKAWYGGITGGLDAVSTALGIPQDAGKIKDGKRLIGLFSKPQRPTKNRPTREPYTKEELSEEWDRFMVYCKRDVEVESYIRKKLSFYKISPEWEKSLYALDQKINDRGIRIDLQMAENAQRIIAAQDEKYTELFTKVTGIERPSMLGQFKEWLSARAGQEIEAITKVNQDDLFTLFKDDADATLALTCRYNTGKTSTKKYDTMTAATGKDGRMRGCLQFYGAQTGRWAGRLLQVQNLPQNHLQNLDFARDVIKNENFETLELLFDDPSDVLRQCIRPCIIPSDGKKFVVSDYSAIEARVIAYLAKEEWVLNVFRTTGKIYEATASKMLGIPMEEIKKPSPERQKGKVATLALGYQGGVGSLKAMGALKMGIPAEELQPIVDQWRQANQHIVAFWDEVQNAAGDVTDTKAPRTLSNGMHLFWRKGILFIRLLSGRLLAYPRMRLEESKKFPGAYQLAYGIVKPDGTWRLQETYGGRLVENIVQATARDCLGYAMLRLEEAGYPIVMHVHDEVIIEVDRDDDSALSEVSRIMGEEIPWAQGLPLTADGYECNYYKKD